MPTAWTDKDAGAGAASAVTAHTAKIATMRLAKASLARGGLG